MTQECTVFKIEDAGEREESRPMRGQHGESERLEKDRRNACWVAYLERMVHGDQAALGSLYDESSRMIYGLLLRMLGNPADAEELLTDVYMQVWRQAGAYDAGRGTVQTWLVTMARSRAIDRLRSSEHRSWREQEPLEEQLHVSTAKGPEAESFASQARARLWAALARLPQEQKVILQLAYVFGLSQTEIAARLRQPLGTVKTRTRMGMLKLREMLGTGTA